MSECIARNEGPFWDEVQNGVVLADSFDIGIPIWVESGVGMVTIDGRYGVWGAQSDKQNGEDSERYCFSKSSPGA